MFISVLVVRGADLAQWLGMHRVSFALLVVTGFLLFPSSAHAGSILFTGKGPGEEGVNLSASALFTINGSQTLCYVNINGLLGFEIGDLRTGQKLHHVEVEGFQQGQVKRHGCPSHGIGLTPDEKEVWLCDAANQRMHIFDNTIMPPKQVASVELRDQPGWITFSLDGKHAYPSTGEIVDIKSRKIIAALKDENGNMVMSEKVVEIHMDGKKAVKAGDQFGIGRVAKVMN